MSVYLWIGCALLASVIVVAGIRWWARRNQVPDEPVNGEMPVTWRYSDRAVMRAYLYLATWLMRKSPRAQTAKTQFIIDYIAKRFKDAYFDTSLELEQALKQDVHMRSVAGWINRRMRDAAERKQLIDFLIALSFADGDLTQMEYVALVRFGELTGVRLSYIESEVLKRKQEHNHEFEYDTTMDLLSNRSLQRRKALSCLGLQDPVTPEIIRKTYRKLAKQFHPDKLIHLPEEARNEATKRFHAIREASDWLLRE